MTPIDTVQKFDNIIDNNHLLKHPYYQAWNAGSLQMSDLKYYAEQYFAHENAFPQGVALAYAKCSDSKDRKILLNNIIDEEMGEKSHPELWLDFAEEMGADRESVKNSKLSVKTKELVDGFRALCEASYEEALGAIYAYERQVKEVAQTKIEGLETHYGKCGNAKALQFFKTHLIADEWHSQEIKDLIAKLPESSANKALAACETAAKLLWGFLDGVEEYRQNNKASAA